MPVARYQLEDGRVARFQVPDGTTPQQAQQIGVDFFASQQEQPVPQQPTDQAGGFVEGVKDFGQGLRRGVEKITGGAAQRIFETSLSFNESQLKDLAEGINSGEIDPTEENLAKFDQLSIMVRKVRETLGGAEQRETQRREEFSPIQERSPISSAAGEIAGQIIPTLAIPGAGAATLPGKIAAGAATGAAIGAAQPTVGKESVSERASVGALTGGVVPAALEGVVAPAAKAVINKFSDIGVVKLLEKAAPSIDTLKDSARVIYNRIDELGARINQNKTSGLFDNIIKALKRGGADVDVTPKASGLIRRLESEKANELTVTELDTVRKVAQTVAGELNKSESRLGTIAIDEIDRFLDDLSPSSVIGGKNVGKDLREARKFWGRARRAEEIDIVFKNAEGQASGFENGLRTQFRSLLKRIDKGKLRGFSPEEIKAMRTIEQGTNAANIAKLLGKFGLTNEKTAQALLPAGGAGTAFAFGGGPAAVAVVGVGTVSKVLAKKLTEGKAKFADSIVRAGPNAKKITRAYISNVPKRKRSVEELTELLLRPDVKLGPIKETGNKLVDDAIFFASNIQKPAIVAAVGEE